MRRILLIIAVALGTLAVGPNVFLASAVLAQMPQLIRVKVGDAFTMSLGGKPREVSVENEKIATVELLEDGQVRVTGVTEGNTTLLGIASDGNELIMPIIVEPRAEPKK